MSMKSTFSFKNFQKILYFIDNVMYHEKVSIFLWWSWFPFVQPSPSQSFGNAASLAAKMMMVLMRICIYTMMIHDTWCMIHDTRYMIHMRIQIYIMVKWMYVCLCVAKNDHFHEFYQDQVWYVFHLNVLNTNLTNKRCIECLFLAIWVHVHRSQKISTFSRKLFGASCESPKKQRNTETISKKSIFLA